MTDDYQGGELVNSCILFSNWYHHSINPKITHNCPAAMVQLAVYVLQVTQAKALGIPQTAEFLSC